ncbi:hypothetical protein ACLK19_18530 [Escherichia coli]
MARRCAYPVVVLITEWRDEDGNVEVVPRSAIGRTMRLGAQHCHLVTVAGCARCTCADHRRAPPSPLRSQHMLLNRSKRQAEVAGCSADEKLVEIIEIPDHPWFVARQLHPEFTRLPVMVTRCSPVLEGGRRVSEA